MKKEVKKKIKKETDTEILSRLIVNGFEDVNKHFGQIDKRFEQVDKRFEQVDKRFEQVDQRFEQMDQKFEQIGSEISFVKQKVFSIEEEQKETNRRLASLERKQIGTVLSLDETVHRNEFNEIVHRVEKLENK